MGCWEWRKRRIKASKLNKNWPKGTGDGDRRPTNSTLNMCLCIDDAYVYTGTAHQLQQVHQDGPW